MLKRLNRNLYFGNFRGLLGDLRGLIFLTLTLLPVRLREDGDFRCFQQADKYPRVCGIGRLVSQFSRVDLSHRRLYLLYNTAAKCQVRAGHFEQRDREVNDDI